MYQHDKTLKSIILKVYHHAKKLHWLTGTRETLKEYYCFDYQDLPIKLMTKMLKINDMVTLFGIKPMLLTLWGKI